MQRPDKLGFWWVVWKDLPEAETMSIVEVGSVRGHMVVWLTGNDEPEELDGFEFIEFIPARKVETKA